MREQPPAAAGSSGLPGKTLPAEAVGAALAIPRAVSQARVMHLFTHDHRLDRCDDLYGDARLGVRC